MNLSKKVEDLTHFAQSVRVLSPHKHTKVGETFTAWRKKNPEVNVDKFRSNHFNHRCD